MRRAGRDTNDSDIDILFEIRKPLSLMELSRIERDLSDLPEMRTRIEAHLST